MLSIAANPGEYLGDGITSIGDSYARCVQVDDLRSKQKRSFKGPGGEFYEKIHANSAYTSQESHSIMTTLEKLLNCNEKATKSTTLGDGGWYLLTFMTESRFTSKRLPTVLNLI